MAISDQTTLELSTAPSPLRNPLILALLVLTLGNMGVSGWMLYNQHSRTDHREFDAAAVTVPPSSEQSPPAAQSAMIALEPFIVNLADSSGRRYLKVNFELEVSPPQGIEEVKKKTSQIRDGILLVLTSKSFDDIRSTAGKTQVREEILLEVNKLLTTGKALKLYFKDFVVQ